MMKVMEFSINRTECSKLAHDIFLETSGVGRKGRKYEKMRDAAFKMRKHIETNVDIRFACHYYNKVDMDGDKAIIGGETFSCKAFERISPESVDGAYAYAVCAGDFALPDENIMDQLYADIWGTSFADAVRLLIKKEIEARSRLSDSFGPGFYGMHMTEMSKLDRLLDFENLGIELRHSQIMVPLKSCAGLYLEVNDKYEMLDAACSSCLGSQKSCRMCQIYGGR